MVKYVTLENLTYFSGKLDDKLEVQFATKADNSTVEALQTKVETIENVGGQPNVIETVKVNDIALAVSEKAVNIDLSAYALKTDVAAALDWKGTKATVSALPTTGNAKGDIWHVTANGGEYAWDGTEWQELGSIVDLSAYAKTADVTTAISNAVAPKANSADVYTKTQVYTKTEVDTALSGKSDDDHVHAIADVTDLQTTLDGKAAKSHTHTIANVSGLQDALDAKAVKTEVNSALALKANAANVYTKTEIDGKVTTINDAVALKVNTSDLVAITNAEIDAMFATA